MQQLQKSHTIIVRALGYNSNGSDEHAAIVTQVWSQPAQRPREDPINWRAMCNVKILPDCGEPVDITSIWVFATESQTRAMANSHHAVGWLREDSL